MKQLRVLLLPLEGMLVHRRVTPSSMSPVPIYTPGWRETMRGKVTCLRKQNDGRYWASNHQPSDLKSNAQTTTPPCPHWPKIDRRLNSLRAQEWPNECKIKAEAEFKTLLQGTRNAKIARELRLNGNSSVFTPNGSSLSSWALSFQPYVGRLQPFFIRF